MLSSARFQSTVSPRGEHLHISVVPVFLAAERGISLITWLWRLGDLCSHRTVIIKELILCRLPCLGHCTETETYPESFCGKDLFACPGALT